jgi:hypothetical protein
VLEVYSPELPQSYRFPGLMRVFAAFLAGQMDSLKELLDDAVEGARRYGRESDLAFALQIRARTLNDWVGGLPQAVLDSNEALEIYTRTGDDWGRSEALAAQAEAMSNEGDGLGAAETYRQSIELAEQLGAHHEVPMLKVRLGEALLPTEPERGEALIRAALAEVDSGSQASDGAELFGNLVLCAVHSRRGEYEQALARLDHLTAQRRILGPLVPEVFSGLLLCIRSWVVARSGRPEQGLGLLREGRAMMRVGHGGAAGVFAEHMTVLLLPSFIGTLLLVAQERNDLRIGGYCAVLLGAHDSLHGPRGTSIERAERAEAQQAVRHLLGEAEYEVRYAEGGGLGLSGTAALLDEVVNL